MADTEEATSYGSSKKLKQKSTKELNTLARELERRMQEAAKALLTAEFVRKTKQYEPRVRVMRVEWTQNHARDGGIVPKVVVSFV